MDEQLQELLDRVASLEERIRVLEEQLGGGIEEGPRASPMGLTLAPPAPAGPFRRRGVPPPPPAMRVR